MASGAAPTGTTLGGRAHASGPPRAAALTDTAPARRYPSRAALHASQVGCARCRRLRRRARAVLVRALHRSTWEQLRNGACAAQAQARDRHRERFTPPFAWGAAVTRACCCALLCGGCCSGDHGCRSAWDVARIVGCQQRARMGQCVAKPEAGNDIDGVAAAPLPGAAAKRSSRGGAARVHAKGLRRGAVLTAAGGRGGAADGVTPIGNLLVAAAARSPRPVHDALVAAASRRVAITACGVDDSAERVASLRSLHTIMPRRDADGASALARRSSVPAAPGVLYTHLEAAIAANNYKWATGSAEVGGLLAEDVEYTDLRGELACGKQAALESMDAGMERLLRRISRSTRSGSNDHIKLKADGPKAAGRGVWVMIFTFKLCVSRRACAAAWHTPASQQRDALSACLRPGRGITRAAGGMSHTDRARLPCRRRPNAARACAATSCLCASARSTLSTTRAASCASPAPWPTPRRRSLSRRERRGRRALCAVEKQKQRCSFGRGCCVRSVVAPTPQRKGFASTLRLCPGCCWRQLATGPVLHWSTAVTEKRGGATTFRGATSPHPQRNVVHSPAASPPPSAFRIPTSPSSQGACTPAAAQRVRRAARAAWALERLGRETAATARYSAAAAARPRVSAAASARAARMRRPRTSRERCARRYALCAAPGQQLTAPRCSGAALRAPRSALRAAAPPCPNAQKNEQPGDLREPEVRRARTVALCCGAARASRRSASFCNQHLWSSAGARLTTRAAPAPARAQHPVAHRPHGCRRRGGQRRGCVPRRVWVVRVARATADHCFACAHAQR